MAVLRASREYTWLRRLGVEDRDIIRALRLARRSTLVSINREAVVAVPSQRLGLLPRERLVSHTDLLELLRGGGHRVTAARVGRLPEEQQLYLVRVTPSGASCSCPATRLAGDPLCIHKLAAAVLLYRRGRLDLLGWLPGAVERKKRWRLLQAGGARA
ncbi:hypothetical protein CF15_01625 [Pyrodictium occultum]|uniref:SWIM-type domain-containing protein n=1 Tax=Pyrodictium occultum TaxID=2309 RepID=A0A0V8RUD9_PYROC|nr:SWIM zinc finger family protein [Pyrodictium occultum]KSW11562.1 hypothetical protein CF15_01625 [Pyrodictium occultum]